MNLESFKSLLESRKGASPITLTTLTEPDWKPIKETGPNPFKGSVKKRCKINGMINWSYETAVNRQRIREGLEPDFESLPRRWGTRIHGTPWVTHNGKLYLEIKSQNVYEVEYLDANGIPVNGVKEFVKSRNPSTRQGLEDDIIPRDYWVGNILSFTWNGEYHEMDEEVRRLAA